MKVNFKLARVITCGVGLTMKQQFEALSSKGEDKSFINECFVRRTLKNDIVGFELLSKDFKVRVFVPKEKILSLVILSEDLQRLQKAPNILYIADLNAELAQSLGLERAKIYLRKNDLHHSIAERKSSYNQNIPLNFFKDFPNILKETKEAFIDKIHKNFFIVKDIDADNIAIFAINKDKLGNYILHTKKVERDFLNNAEFNQVSAAGLAPAIPAEPRGSTASTTLRASTDTNDEIVTKQNLKEADIFKKSDDEMKNKAVEATPSATALKDIIGENGLKLDKAQQALKEKVNFEALNDEQKGIFEVFTGQKDKIVLQGKDIDDLYALEKGTRKGGARKIMIKHAGLEKTGGLSNDELLNMMEVVRKGELDKDSFILADNKIRYAYDLNKDDVKLRLIVDEYNDGRKVFDFYSDRNFIDYGETSWKKPIQDTPKNQDEFFKSESEEVFGTNYPEFKGKGQEAIQHLLKTKSGQVQGAFYRDDLGDITLIWGEAGTGKSDGYGLAKIAKFHQEALKDLDEAINKGEFFKDEKGRANIKFNDVIVGLRDNWQGKKMPHWVITSYKKDDGLDKVIDSVKSKTSKEDYSFATHQENSSEKGVKNQDEFKDLEKAVQKDENHYSQDSQKIINEARNSGLTQQAHNFKGVIENEIKADLDDLKAFDRKQKNIIAKISNRIEKAQALEKIRIHHRTADLDDFKKAGLKENDAHLAGEKLNDIYTEIDEIASLLYKKSLNLREHLNGRNFWLQSDKINDLIKSMDKTNFNFNFVLENIYSKDLSEVLQKYKTLNSRYKRALKEYESILKSSDNADKKGLKNTENTQKPLKSTLERDLSDTAQVSEKEALSESEVKNQQVVKENEQGDFLIEFNGKKHIIKADLADKWLKTFELENLTDDFIPNFTPQIKELLNKNGIDEIKLKIGSLFKLEINNRTQYLDRIKPTLQEPNALLRQNDGALIFVKDFEDKKFFTSIAKDKNGEWIITSNAPKSLNNLKNKLKQGGELLFNDLNELEIVKINANDFTQEAQSPSQQALNSNYTTKKDFIDTKTQERLKNNKEFIENTQEIEKMRTLIKDADRQIDILISEQKEIGEKIDNLIPRTYKDGKKRQLYLNKIKADNSPRYKQINDLIAEYDHLELEYKRLFDESKAIKKDLSPKIWELKYKNYILTAQERQKLSDEFHRANPNYEIKDDEIINTPIETYIKKENTEKTSDYKLAKKDAIKEAKFKESENIDEAQKQFIQEIIDDLKRQRLNIEMDNFILPLKDYGTNYAEFYRDGKGAINKIITEAKDYEARKKSGDLLDFEKEQGQYKGQVAGAFYRDDLGDITLIWGEVTNPITHEGYGLAHILDKHPDFNLNLIPQIINKGDLVENAGVKTIILKDGESELRVGLSKGFKGKGDDEWIITAYERKSRRPQNFDQDRPSVQNGNNLSTSDKKNYTTKLTKEQIKANKAEEKYYFNKDEEVKILKQKYDEAQSRVRDLENTGEHRLKELNYSLNNFIEEAKIVKSEYKNITEARKKDGKYGEMRFEKFIKDYDYNLKEIKREIEEQKEIIAENTAKKLDELPQALKDLELAKKDYETSKAEFDALPIPHNYIDVGEKDYERLIKRYPNEKEVIKELQIIFKAKSKGTILYDLEGFKNNLASLGDYVKQFKERGYSEAYIDFVERLGTDDNAILKLLEMPLNDKKLLESENIESFVKRYFKPTDSDNAYQKALSQRLIKKNLDLINSENYQKNLKEWAKGSSEHFLNDDKTPIMIDGFYYSDKELLKNDPEAHKQFIASLKYAKNKNQKMAEIYMNTTRKAVLNSGEFDNTANVLNANQHIGTGLLTGTLNAFETDEDGNTSFNPSKFVTGFIGGSLASKIGLDTIKRLSKYPRAREIFTKLENEKSSKVLEKNQNKDIITRSNFDKGIREVENLSFTTPNKNKKAYTLRGEVITFLKTISAKPIINKNDGRVAIINRAGRNKIISQEAVNESLKNGFTQEQHFEIAKHLKELYENAFLREIQSDKKGDPNLKIPRYEVKFTLDGQATIAKITLKETLTGLYKGNKIYTLELESLAKLSTEP